MSFYKQRRRPLGKYQAGLVGTLTAALLLSIVSTPTAGAASSGSFVSGSSSASSGTAVSEASSEAPSQISAPMQRVPSNEVNPSLVKVTEEQAVKLVRDLFPVLKDAQMSGTSLTNGDYSGQMDNKDPVWQIQWTIQRGNSSSGFSSQVNAVTGDLIHSGIYGELLSEPAYYPPKLNKQQALEVARKFIAKAAPSLKSQTFEESKFIYGMPITPLFGPVLYTFSFQANYEGVKVQGLTVSVTVNGNGDVTDFNFYNNLTSYPSSKPKMLLTEAKKKWEQELQFMLAYVPVDSRWNAIPEKWTLAYVPDTPSILDAQTGKWTDGMNNESQVSKPTYVALTATGESYKARPVTADEAIKRITTFAEIPEGYNVQNKQLNKGRNGEHDTWSIRWGKDNSGGFYDGRSAQVDAETGQLLSFYVDWFGPMGNQDQTKPKSALQKEKAVQIADRWMLDNISDATSYRRVDNHFSNPAKSEEETGYVTINYQLFYNDLMVQTRNVTISLNSEGKIVSLSSPPSLESTVSLKSLEAKLTPEDAKSKVLKSTEMELVYIRSGGYNILPSGKYVPLTMTLAYRATDLEYGEVFYRVVDAISGELINMYGSISNLSNEVVVTDIHDHWAKSTLETVINHGVITPDKQGKVYPNKTITAGEFIRMVALSMNPYIDNENYYNNGGQEKLFADVDSKSPYYQSVNYWIGIGWLKGNASENLQPDAVLTREQLAVYLAKISGYEKFALRLGKDASTAPLKDAKMITNPGAGTLALKLGLMNAPNDSFNPQSKVSLADAAVILIRLAQIQGELDRPLMR